MQKKESYGVTSVLVEKYEKVRIFVMKNEDIESVLKTLAPEEEAVIRMRYGFDDKLHTLEEVGRKFNITRKRIMQIEAKALRMLRHPFQNKVSSFKDVQS